MIKDLGGRFTKIAKSFGNGLKNAIKGGGIVALAAGLADKILNPLKETQEALDKFLSSSDDIITNAAEFGTTPGKLLKLREAGRATGLKPETLFMMLQKFQVALAQARDDKRDPSKPAGVLEEFLNVDDTVDAFFQFSQSLKNASNDVRTLAKASVFGERLMGKSNDFFQQDLPALISELTPRLSSDFDESLNMAGSMNDLKDKLEAQRILEDTFKKGKIIGPQMIYSQAKTAQQQLDQENKRIQSYDSLIKTEQAASDIKNRFEDLFMTISSQLPILVDGLNAVVRGIDWLKPHFLELVKWIREIGNSRFIKGLFK